MVAAVIIACHSMQSTVGAGLRGMLVVKGSVKPQVKVTGMRVFTYKLYQAALGSDWF